MNENSERPFSERMKPVLNYLLAFALAYIAAKWGIVPNPPPTPVVVVSTLPISTALPTPQVQP